MKISLLSLLLGAALLSDPAYAQSPRAQPAAAPRAESAPPPAATDLATARRELEVAKRELERASSRLAELTQQLTRSEIETALARPAFARPIIGIVMAPDDQAGVRLGGITPESPAAKAGLKSGDRLLRINGKPIEGDHAGARLAQAQRLIGRLEEGEQVRLTYEREGATREVTLKAAARPGLMVWLGDHGEWEKSLHEHLPIIKQLREPLEFGSITPFAGCGIEGEDCLMAPIMEAYRWHGLRLAALNPKLGRYFGVDRGVLVLATPQDDLQGLEPGDVILAVDGEPVDRPKEAMRRMRSKAPGERIELEFLRDRKTQQLKIEAPRLARFPLFAPPVPPAPPLPPNAPAPKAHPAPVPHPPVPPAPAPASPESDQQRGVIESVLRG